MNPLATPFRKVLVANRGEIALRVIRSARDAGYRTVAVYSTADARAPHVLAADQAVCIGEAQPAQSYLNIPALIDAARRTGADAVHPGYGFLAENEHFAQACRDAGLVFIGPSPRAIASMGNKAGAKRLMLEADVPCVPGYQGDDQRPERLAGEAERIGYPVMIKAVAGGGGRGMRLVPSAGELPELLRSAQSEALNAFGDSTVILERAIADPRHIEIQILADRHGNAIHLGERDCSVQRRHQKLIEEAPSPAVTPELRERMGATAVAAIKAIAYEGAGTLEFLLDRDGQYYFMEMNTRLQVEHPVTEAITGLDLVALQLSIAAGDPLPIRQEDVRFQGHAIEVRLCAEDADAGFTPQSGTMALWHPPPRLRVEHALASGTEIPPYYDSMIAKIIAHGATREAARRQLVSGLEDTVALGVTTNQQFLVRCLAHPQFVDGEVNTSFIGAHAQALQTPDAELLSRASALAAVLLVETDTGARPRVTGRRLTLTLPIHLRFEIGVEARVATLRHLAGHRYEVLLDAHGQTVEIVDLAAHRLRFILDDIMETASYVREGSRLFLGYRGRPLRVLDTSRAASRRTGFAGAGDGRLRATMNGRVVAVMVSVGDRVEPGQPVVTLEAMKMEHIHAAPVAGTVTAVHVVEGHQVPSGRIVLEIEPEVQA
ncbi:MAG: acetyl-CoA carboxylase biotin carboxylase subunit [Burkholderiaceae bacterium]